MKALWIHAPKGRYVYEIKKNKGKQEQIFLKKKHALNAPICVNIRILPFSF